MLRASGTDSKAKLEQNAAKIAKQKTNIDRRKQRKQRNTKLEFAFPSFPSVHNAFAFSVHSRSADFLEATLMPLPQRFIARCYDPTGRWSGRLCAALDSALWRVVCVDSIEQLLVADHGSAGASPSQMEAHPALLVCVLDDDYGCRSRALVEHAATAGISAFAARRRDESQRRYRPCFLLARTRRGRGADDDARVAVGLAAGRALRGESAESGA